MNLFNIITWLGRNAVVPDNVVVKAFNFTLWNAEWQVLTWKGINFKLQKNIKIMSLNKTLL